MRAWVALAVVAVAVALGTEELYEDYLAWTVEHGKAYADAAEYVQRYQNYRANAAMVAHLNRQGRGRFALNHFADLSQEEFAALYLRPFPVSDGPRDGPFVDGPRRNAYPEKKNWVDEGAVNKVRDQGSCGSCYAFSAVENMEGIYKLAHDELPVLSVQQIVDCERDCMIFPGTTQKVCDAGCNGGLMPNVFTYAIRVGMVTEAEYPYIARVQTCRTDLNPKYHFKKWAFVKDNEEAMVAALNDEGPLSVAVDATYWSTYSGGIYDASCSSTRMNHAVLLVGYGSEGGKDYWIIQNSWKASWGEKGFIRLIRGKNKCGVNNFVCTIYA